MLMPNIAPALRELWRCRVFARALSAIRRGDLDAANVPLSNVVMQWTIKAMIEARGDLSKAIEHAQRAVALEERTPSGPPDVPKPSHELLGELPRAGRCDSEGSFRKSLLRHRTGDCRW
jgi:hypothetical protein